MTDPESTTAPPDAGKAAVPGTEQKAPVFGAAFSAQGGFAGFTGVPASATKADGEADEGGDGDAEEECKAEFTPLVQLEEVAVSTGEEEEDVLLELKCKLYRFDRDNSEWKERGIGMARFLQSKASKKVRLLMRQEKTLKIRANHIIRPGTKIESHGGNEKAWVWTAMDYADEEPRMEMLAIRFGSAEKAQQFKCEYEKAMGTNEPLLVKHQTDSVDAATAPEAGAEAESGDGKDVGTAVDALAEKVAAAKVED